MPRPAVRITDAMVRQAWVLMQRPGWPATLDEALAHPLYSRLLRLGALAHAVTGRPPRATPPKAATPHQPPSLPRQPAPAWDARRAAANDLEPDHDAHP